jgi:magnesium transporter
MQAHTFDGKTCGRANSPEAIRAAVSAGHTVWLHIGPEDLRTRDLLADTFHLHPLVIEDVWAHSPLPKVADFDGFLHIALHVLDVGSTPDELKTHELDIFLSDKFVITRCPELSIEFEDARLRKLLEKGPAWLAHALADRLVDRYLPLLEQLDQRIAEFETQIIRPVGPAQERLLVNRIFAMKRTLQSVRRTSAHQREVLLQLSRGDYDEIPPKALPFFRHVYEHFLRISDAAEAHREFLGSLLEAFWSVQSNRMNEVMKRLTLMSTIMLPLTFIAGVYGMNFDGMPELRWRYGYPASLGLMLLVALLIVLWFRQKKWI